MVSAEFADEPGLEIAEVTGDGGQLNRDPRQNVAGVAAQSVLSQLAPRERPASRRPAARAQADAAGERPRQLGGQQRGGRDGGQRTVRPPAVEARAAAARARRRDGPRRARRTPTTPAPSLLGGVVLIRGYDPLEIVELPVPAALRVTLVHPHCRVETSTARALLRGHGFTIEQAVANLGNLGALVAGLYRDDLELIGRAIEDRLVEPLRMPLIPGYAAVKAAALPRGRPRLLDLRLGPVGLRVHRQRRWPPRGSQRRCATPSARPPASTVKATRARSTSSAPSGSSNP